MNSNVTGVIVMTVICAAAGGGLAVLKDATAPRIEQQVLTYVQAPTLQQLFPDAENDYLADRKKFTLPDLVDPSKQVEVSVFPIYRGGVFSAVAIENFGTGYGGALGMMVAVDVKTDSILTISPTTMKETPGIGTRILEPSFLRQFEGQGDVALKSAGGQIDALSGATVSSGAATAAVSAAMQQYAALKDEIKSAWQ